MNHDERRFALYDMVRPSYSQGAIPEIRNFLGAGVVDAALDLGSGTGISSRFATAFARSVLAVEPDPGMRAVAEQRRPAAVTVHEGTAQRTGLPPACADVAVIGGGLQAYAGDETRREILRVLRGDAPVVVLWCHLAVHERTVGPFLAYWRRHVGPALVEPFQLNALTEQFLRSPTILYRGIEVHRFDARRLEAFVLSSSSGPNTTASSRRQAVVKDSVRLAQELGGEVPVPFETLCYAARFR